MNRRENPVETRSENKQAVYRYILTHESATRQEICVGLGLSLPTIGQSLSFLESEELITPSGIIRGTGGRNATAYRVSPSGHFAAGLYLSQNHISSVLTDMTGTILQKDRVRIAMDPHQEEYLKEIGRQVDQGVCAAGIETERVLGVGIAVPSLVSEDHETILFGMTHDFSGITRSVLSRYVNYRTKLFHDASVAGYTEVWMNPRFRNAVYLSLNNSIAASLIMDQKIYEGNNRRAGEIGHMIVRPGNGRRCYCGNIGCLDTLCNTGVLESCADGSLSQFFSMLKDGSPEAVACWEEYLDELALAIHNLRMLHDCRIIIGGYVSPYIGEYMESLCSRIDEKNIFHDHARDYVTVSRYQMESTPLVAAIQIMEHYINSL